MKHDAFISYSSAEFEQALWVRNNLEANGISCWMAPDSIPGGASYGDTISTAIDHCQFFVLILSSKAQASQWVTKELDLALNAHVTVLPFMIEKCQLVGEFRLYLPNVQHYYAYADQMQAMEKLINDIRCQMRKPMLPPTLLSGKKFKKKSSGCLWGFLGILAAIAVAGVLLYPKIPSLLGGNLAAQLPEDTHMQQEELPMETTEPTEAATTAPVSTIPPAPTFPTTPPATEAPTTSTGHMVVISPTAMPALDTQLDCNQLSTGLTNHSRQTALPLPLDAIHTATLKQKTDFWYEFVTAGDVQIYRIAALRCTDIDKPSHFSLHVYLYNELGMKLEDFSFSTSYHSGYLDLPLEPGTKYYLKVYTTDPLKQDDIAGFGLFVSPRPSDTGLSQETATELTLGYQHTFVLNSTLSDWLIFRPQESGSYRVTVYNIDVGGEIYVKGVNGTGSGVCSLTPENEDSAETTFYGHAGKAVYFNICTSSTLDEPNGTYVIVIEQN